MVQNGLLCRRTFGRSTLPTCCPCAKADTAMRSAPAVVDLRAAGVGLVTGAATAVRLRFATRSPMLGGRDRVEEDEAAAAVERWEDS